MYGKGTVRVFLSLILAAGVCFPGAAAWAAEHEANAAVETPGVSQFQESGVSDGATGPADSEDPSGSTDAEADGATGSSTGADGSESASAGQGSAATEDPVGGSSGNAAEEPSEKGGEDAATHEPLAAAAPASTSAVSAEEGSHAQVRSFERAAGVQSAQMRSLTDTALNAGDADAGSAANPYRVVVAKGAFCAPSKFWTNGESAIPDMAVLFENREGGSLSGELIASYTMDTSLRNRANLNETWKMAFRFSPYVETGIEDGKLRFATASKGSFETYFPTFQFRLNVAYLTKGLPDDQRIEAGDRVVISYYGNYKEKQTSRGTDYSIDLSVEDSAYRYEREFTVGSDGFVTMDPLPVGGNYEIVPVKPEKVVYSGNIGLANRAASGEGTGTAEDPYVFAMAPTVGSGRSINPYTRPAQFWGVSQSLNSKIAPFAVEFRQFYGAGVSGTLMSSMAFDTITKKNAAWNTFAGGKLRLSPVTAFDTSDGDLRVAFAWKGCFAKYFSDWTFRLDARGLTSGLAEEKRAQAKDKVVLTYYGNYRENQTSAGTDYSIDFSVKDENVVSKVEAVVGEDGYAEFSGEQMLSYGGNYVLSIEKSEPAPNPPDESGDDNENDSGDKSHDGSDGTEDDRISGACASNPAGRDAAPAASAKKPASVQGAVAKKAPLAVSKTQSKAVLAGSVEGEGEKAGADPSAKASAVSTDGAAPSSAEAHPEGVNPSEEGFPYGMVFAAVAAVLLAASAVFFAFVSNGRGKSRAHIGE